MTCKTVAVLPDSDRAYDIIIEGGLLGAAGRLLSSVMTAKRFCIVTDTHIAELPHMLTLIKSMETAGLSVTAPIVLPAGEGTKDFHHLQYIIDNALERGLDRHAAFIALGGGVVGDITGFAAAVLMRGIPFVQIPTTLLAQVDSAVGGKTAINTARGKNLVGAFYQPRAVLIDTDVLQTLPIREMKAGYAEVLKYALINKPAFFNWLEDHAEAILSGDAAAQAEAIAISCHAKAEIVADDEREEKDIRALLNLGHTFAHALEKLGGFDGRLLHGEAVGIGLYWAAAFSAHLGLCSAEDAAKVQAHLEKAEMMTCPPFAVAAADMLEAMRGDKKSRDGKMTLILMKGIGRAFVARDADEAAVLSFLKNITGE
jgi:3-dehydroquinate synthase